MSTLLESYDREERRRSLRIPPDPPLIIRLPAGNYGVVTDVSPEGLGFLASSPLEDATAIPFEIYTDTRSPEAAGQLIWKDDSAKRGGLRFTHLPDDVRALLGSFSLTQQPPAVRDTEPVPNNAVANLEEDLGERAQEHAEEHFESQGPIAPSVSRVRSRKWRVFANSISAAVAFLIALAVWYSINRQGALDSLSHLKRPISAFLSEHSIRPRWWLAPAKSPQAPASSQLQAAPPHAEQSAQTGITSTPKARSLSARASARKIHAAARAPKHESHVPKPAAQETQTNTVQLLWQSVEKGNTEAEIELADMYLEGRGVSKSCSQALVLLTAAQNRNSALAEQKLRSLAQYSCETPDASPNGP